MFERNITLSSDSLEAVRCALGTAITVYEQHLAETRASNGPTHERVVCYLRAIDYAQRAQGELRDQGY